MKYIAFLLSFYILCLVSAPCVDDSLHLGNQDSCKTSHHSNNIPASHPDACSPFCICTCCNVTVTVATGTHVSMPFFSILQSFHPESSRVNSLFDVTFWQPPKIG